MINRLKDLNEALPGLLLGIFLYGILVEVIGVWFASDKLRFSTGLLIGIICAMGMGIHIAMVIEDAVRFNGGTRQLSAKSVVRYLVVVIVFIIMMYFNLGSLIPAFIGLLGLKISAYAQPLLMKLFKRTEDTDEEVKM